MKGCGDRFIYQGLHHDPSRHAALISLRAGLPQDQDEQGSLLCAAVCAVLVVISHETNGAISAVSYLFGVAFGISALLAAGYVNTESRAGATPTEMHAKTLSAPPTRLATAEPSSASVSSPTALRPTGPASPAISLTPANSAKGPTR